MSTNRRRVLRGLIASATLTTFSGCSLLFGPRPDLRVRNFHDQTHEIAVTVAYESSPILDETFSLEPNEQATKTGLFDEVGEYTIEATVDDENSDARAVTVDDPGADIFAVTVQNDGGLSIGRIAP